MQPMRLIAALLAVGVGAGAAVATSQAQQKGSQGQQTHPRMHPRAGRARTAFTVSFTLRESPGHAGVEETDYRVQLSPPSNARQACWPVQPAPVQTGRKGERVRLRLATPSTGWCVDRYAVTVYLQRGPYCPPPTAGERPTPCPEFATQELDVGETHFTVRGR